MKTGQGVKYEIYKKIHLLYWEKREDDTYPQKDFFPPRVPI